MKAVLLVRRRVSLSEREFLELVVWKVPEPVRGSDHYFKYRLAYVAGGKCLLRYDNEAGKGDHRHIGAVEVPYRFVDPDRLLTDFLDEVEELRR